MPKVVDLRCVATPFGSRMATLQKHHRLDCMLHDANTDATTCDTQKVVASGQDGLRMMKKEQHE